MPTNATTIGLEASRISTVIIAHVLVLVVVVGRSMLHSNELTCGFEGTFPCLTLDSQRMVFGGFNGRDIRKMRRPIMEAICTVTRTIARSTMMIMMMGFACLRAFNGWMSTRR